MAGGPLRPDAAGGGGGHSLSARRPRGSTGGESRELRIIRRTWMAQRLPVSSLLDRFGSAENEAEIEAVRERTAGLGSVEQALWGPGGEAPPPAPPPPPSALDEYAGGEAPARPRRHTGVSAARRARDHVTIARLRGPEFSRHVHEVMTERRKKMGARENFLHGNIAALRAATRGDLAARQAERLAREREREAAVAEAKRALDGDCRARREAALALGATRAGRVARLRAQRVGLVLVAFGARLRRLCDAVVAHHAFLTKMVALVKIQAAMRGALQRAFVGRVKKVKRAFRKTVAHWRFNVRDRGAPRRARALPLVSRCVLAAQGVLQTSLRKSRVVVRAGPRPERERRVTVAVWHEKVRSCGARGAWGWGRPRRALVASHSRRSLARARATQIPLAGSHRSAVFLRLFVRAAHPSAGACVQRARRGPPPPPPPSAPPPRAWPHEHWQALTLWWLREEAALLRDLKRAARKKQEAQLERAAQLVRESSTRAGVGKSARALVRVHGPPTVRRVDEDTVAVRRVPVVAYSDKPPRRAAGGGGAAGAAPTLDTVLEGDYVEGGVPGRARLAALSQV